MALLPQRSQVFGQHPGAARGAGGAPLFPQSRPLVAVVVSDVCRPSLTPTAGLQASVFFKEAIVLANSVHVGEVMALWDDALRRWRRCRVVAAGRWVVSVVLEGEDGIVRVAALSRRLRPVFVVRKAPRVSAVRSRVSGPDGAA